MAQGGGKMQRGGARVVEADRSQLAWGRIDLDADLPEDHMARLVWDFTARLDLTLLYDKVRAREGSAGRPAADPRVLLALWLLATTQGIGSARALDRLTEESLGYRWLCQGVPINYHGLADFRVAHAEVLDDLLTRSLAAFIADGLVKTDEIIVDGTKVKASAGRSSYHRPSRLEAAEAAARTRIAALKAEVEADPAASRDRVRAARERAARERLERIAQAQATLEAIDQERCKRARHDAGSVERMRPPSVSTSDPGARLMRFADGGVRPGWNVQVAVTSTGQFITAIRATDRRQDSGLAASMHAESERRIGRPISRLLADTGYVHGGDIEALAARAAHPVEVFMPPPRDRTDLSPASLARRGRERARESDAMKAWRRRMASEVGEAGMRRRKRIERVNGHMKTHGLAAVAVRGLAKVQAVALLHALAHNFLTALRLAADRTRPAIA